VGCTSTLGSAFSSDFSDDSSQATPLIILVEEYLLVQWYHSLVVFTIRHAWRGWVNILHFGSGELEVVSSHGSERAVGKRIWEL